MSNGAILHGKTKATDIQGTEVTTEHGFVINCRRVIVAVDGRLELILPELASKVVTKRL